MLLQWTQVAYSTALCITEYTSIQSSLFQCSPHIAYFLSGNDNGFQHFLFFRQLHTSHYTVHSRTLAIISKQL